MLCYVLREKLSLRIDSCSFTLTKSKGLRDFSQWERQLCQYEFDTYTYPDMSFTHLSRSSREAVYANNSQVFDSNY